MARTPDGVGVNRWLLLFVVMAGTFMAILDSTIMNVALARIISYFGSTMEHVKWVSTGFMIAAAVSMPLTGWLGQRFGYGTVYLYALALFVGGAAASALSWDLQSLIAARVVQGLGAGVVQPTSIAILTRTFPPEVRGRVFGIWAIGVMVAPSLGPTVGGFLLEAYNWRAIFIMSLVVGLLTLGFALAVLERGSDEEPTAFDFNGYFALAVFLVVALLTVSNGQELGWGSGTILLGWGVSAVSLLLFVALEWDAQHPLVPLRLFRIPDLSLALFLTIYRSLGLFGGVFLMPIFLTQVQQRDSLQVGLLMMPGAMAMALTSPVAGLLTDRFGGRWPTVVGIALMSYSLFAYHAVDALTGIWAILWPQLVRGVGIGLVMTPVVTTGMNAVAREDAGHASWMLNLCQRGGGAFAISILSFMLHRRTALHRELLGGSALATAPLPRALIERGRSLGFSSAQAGAAARAAFGRVLGLAAVARAFQDIFVLTALITATAVVPAILLTVFRAPEPRAATGVRE